MSFWSDHGTKILGYAATAAGGVLTIAAAASPTALTAVLGPKWGAYVGAAVAIWGAATAKRGYTNSANQPPVIK